MPRCRQRRALHQACGLQHPLREARQSTYLFEVTLPSFRVQSFLVGGVRKQHGSAVCYSTHSQSSSQSPLQFACLQAPKMEIPASRPAQLSTQVQIWLSERFTRVNQLNADRVIS